VFLKVVATSQQAMFPPWMDLVKRKKIVEHEKRQKCVYKKKAQFTLNIQRKKKSNYNNRKKEKK
jgi:hypothetical protein